MDNKGWFGLVKNADIFPALFASVSRSGVGNFCRMEADPRFRIGYSRIELEENKKFSGIPVNTSMSTVHVPTNVFDGDPKVKNIQPHKTVFLEKQNSPISPYLIGKGY